MKVGVATWNVHGDDKNSGAGAARCSELDGIMQAIRAVDNPIDVICLQETCGTNGALYDWLSNQGYSCSVIQEGNGAGRYLLFGVYAALGMMAVGPDRVFVDYKEASGKPMRYPAEMGISFPSYPGRKMPGVQVFNFHAPLGGYLQEGVEALSEAAELRLENTNALVVVAGDLNITTSYAIADDDGEEVPLLKQVFPSFIGASHHLDHIFAAMKGQDIAVTKAVDYMTSSDHNLIYVEFDVPH